MCVGEICDDVLAMHACLWRKGDRTSKNGEYIADDALLFAVGRKEASILIVDGKEVDEKRTFERSSCCAKLRTRCDAVSLEQENC